MSFYIGILLAATTLFAISLHRTYSQLPVKELKRRSRKGDMLASALFKVATYGSSLSALLWIFVGLTAGLFFWLVSANSPAWIAVGLSGSLIWVGFVWLPATSASTFGQKLAQFVSPALAKILYYLSPVLDSVTRFIRRHRPVRIHTGLYERADLIELLETQAVQVDNRIEEAELEIAKYAMSFGDLLVRDVMTPKRIVNMVSADAEIGPVLMSELHDSGNSRFPVYEATKENLVGILFLRDLINLRTGGKIKNIMDHKLLYIHEEQSLFEALTAILKTHQHLFAVVNGFEEYVGIITIEDVLEKIVGRQIIDEFDQYDDMRAVAALKAHEEHADHIKQEKIVAKEVIK
jgi:CBS domain containing-hemolysin-like protein